MTGEVRSIPRYIYRTKPSWRRILQIAADTTTDPRGQDQDLNAGCHHLYIPGQRPSIAPSAVQTLVSFPVPGLNSLREMCIRIRRKNPLEPVNRDSHLCIMAQTHDRLEEHLPFGGLRASTIAAPFICEDAEARHTYRRAADSSHAVSALRGSSAVVIDSMVGRVNMAIRRDRFGAWHVSILKEAHANVENQDMFSPR